MATIRVFKPCSCESCASGGRWFQCRAPEPVAEYECSGFDGIESCPHPDAVAQVEQMQPGMVFVYASMGDYYGTLVADARRRLALKSSKRAA